jgi:enoyl-CoA hydratase/carnithine racemase
MWPPAEPGQVLEERLGAVTVITLDDRHTLNALTTAMARTLARFLRAADADQGVRCVVITGANGAFTSGHNLHELRANPEAAYDEVANDAFSLPRLMAKPVVAAIDGATYGGGLILALASDIRIAAPACKLCASGSRLGLLPVGGQISWLPHMIGSAVAAEMLMTGEPVDAETAHRTGLVSRVVPASGLRDAAVDLAGRIAANSQSVVASVKRGVRISLRDGVSAAEAFEASDAPRHFGLSANAALLGNALKPAGTTSRARP